LPDWWDRPAPGEPDPPTPLAPSQPLPDEAATEPRAYSPLLAHDPRRWQRGLLLHDLLRHLPGLPAAQRAEAARRFLAQPARGLAPDEVESWANEALAVTEAPAHAALFGEDQARYLVTVPSETVAKTVSDQAKAAGIDVQRLGVTGGDALTLPGEAPISVQELTALHEGWLPAYMAGER
jgi:hypothetical protein